MKHKNNSSNPLKLSHPSSPAGAGFSPYWSMINNPISFYDPDEESPDDYRLHEDGSIEFVKSTDDNFDRLILPDLNKAPIIINDQTLLPSLSVLNENAVRVAVGSRKSRFDIFKIFQAAADYTNVEWMAGRLRSGHYFVGTKHNPDVSPRFDEMGLVRKDAFSFVHSHPDIQHVTGTTFFESEKRSMGYKTKLGSPAGDQARTIEEVLNNGYTYPYIKYVYIPQSGRLWGLGVYKPHYIRHINNDYRRFFFGTF